MDEFAVPCLVIGAKGMLGRDLCSAMKLAEIQIIEMDVDEIDISSKPSVLEAFHRTKPSMVINLAAVTDVDGCESKQDLAFNVNAVGAENLAIASREFGSFLIHMMLIMYSMVLATSPTGKTIRLIHSGFTVRPNLKEKEESESPFTRITVLLERSGCMENTERIL